MKVCDPVKRGETGCRPDGCHRYDCEKSNLTFKGQLARYKEHYPNQAQNFLVKKIDKAIHNQAVRDVHKLGTSQEETQ